ncbi:MAG: hypothetical protein RR209_01050, partial [Angelakisella sp.]
TEIVGGGRAAYLQKQYGEAVNKLRAWAEYGFACGGMVLKVLPQGKSLQVECIGADRFKPIAERCGVITEAEFCETIFIASERADIASQIRRGTAMAGRWR